MTLSLTASSRPFGEYHNVRLHGGRVAGGHRLSVQFQGRIREAASAEPLITIEHLSGGIEVATTNGKPVHFGKLTHSPAPGLIEQHRHSQDSQPSFTIQTEPSAIEEADALRPDGDVRIRIYLEGISRFRSDSKEPVSHRAETVYGSGDFAIPQSEWARVLKEAGYGDRLTFDIPIPSASANADLQIALHHLRDARTHFIERRYRDAVSSCRLVAEKAQSILGKPPTDTRKPSAYTKEERISVALDSILKVGHLVHHTDPLCASTTFDRGDARTLIGMLASLLANDK